MRNAMNTLEKAIKEADRSTKILEFKPPEDKKQADVWNSVQAGKTTTFHKGKKYLHQWRNPTGIDIRNGYIEVRARVSHKCALQALVEAANAYLVKLSTELKPSDIIESPIQSAEIATAGWLGSRNTSNLCAQTNLTFKFNEN